MCRYVVGWSVGDSIMNPKLKAKYDEWVRRGVNIIRRIKDKATLKMRTGKKTCYSKIPYWWDCEKSRIVCPYTNSSFRGFR